MLSCDEFVQLITAWKFAGNTGRGRFTSWVMAAFLCKVTCSLPTVDEGGNCPVIQKQESSHVIYRVEILCQASITPETVRHSAAHSWINTYYFTWQHMFLALHHLKFNAIHVPMTIQHPLRLAGDSPLLWARCLQCCIAVCCFCMRMWEWVYAAVLHLSSGLDIYQHQTVEIMVQAHTHTHTCVLTQISSTMTT